MRASRRFTSATHQRSRRASRAERTHQRRVADRQPGSGRLRGSFSASNRSRGSLANTATRVRAVGRQVVLEEVAGALQRGLEGDIGPRGRARSARGARRSASSTSERTARLARRRGRELRRIQVQVEAQDDRSVEPQARPGLRSWSRSGALTCMPRFYPKATRRTLRSSTLVRFGTGVCPIGRVIRSPRCGYANRLGQCV